MIAFAYTPPPSSTLKIAFSHSLRPSLPSAMSVFRRTGAIRQPLYLRSSLSPSSSHIQPKSNEPMGSSLPARAVLFSRYFNQPITFSRPAQVRAACRGETPSNAGIGSSSCLL